MRVHILVRGNSKGRGCYFRYNLPQNSTLIIIVIIIHIYFSYNTYIIISFSCIFCYTCTFFFIIGF